MSKNDSTLTQDRLKALLHYDPQTGIFTRLIRLAQRSLVGDIAGGIERGKNRNYKRINISVDGRNHRAHRLAWLYVYGEWPTGEIDHKHGHDAGNGIDNLREVTHQINCQNLRQPPGHNTSGFIGVYWEARRHKWFAKIVLDKKQYRLGTFDTPEDAHAAYLAAKRKLHVGCTI